MAAAATNATHGAHSPAVLAPRVTSIKRSICARMGLRQAELSWAGRELLDLYCRSRAKIAAVDVWLESNEMIRSDGTVAPVMKTYWVAVNAATRQLEALRTLVAEMARDDQRYMHALAALEREASS